MKLYCGWVVKQLQGKQDNIGEIKENKLIYGRLSKISLWQFSS